MKNEWNAHASNLLKAELTRAGMSYSDLIPKLEAIGVHEGYKGIANKINRGAFTFVFFMQCMNALGRDTVRLGD